MVRWLICVVRLWFGVFDACCCVSVHVWLLACVVLCSVLFVVVCVCVCVCCCVMGCCGLM